MSEAQAEKNQPENESSDGNHSDDHQDDSQGERISILAVARTWWPWCLGLIFVLTIVWTALVAWTVVASGEHDGIPQTIVAIISASAPGEFLIIIYSLMVITGLDALGGFLMVTKRYLMNKWVKPQEERLREEGRTEGRQEERQYWLDRERRRADAEAQGIPFDEPLPGDDEPRNESANGRSSR